MKLNKLKRTTAALLMASLMATSAAALPFQDVADTAWYYMDIERAYNIGLINGKTATEFYPDDYITYAEAVKLAACMDIVYSGADITLTNGTPWYKPYAEYCVSSTGNTNGIRMPQEQSTWTFFPALCRGKLCLRSTMCMTA